MAIDSFPRTRRNAPIRVCFLVENLLPAGTERWIMQLIRDCDRSRISPSLVLVDGSSTASRALEPTECPVVRLGLHHLRSWRLGMAVARLHQFFREQRIEIAQVHHADPSYLGIPVARWAGVAHIVQTKYDVGYWLRGADLWAHRFLRPWVDVTLANCRACRQAAIEQEWADAARVQIIENGIPLDRFRSFEPLQVERLRQVSHERPLHVGMLATLRRIKNPYLLLDAAQIWKQADAPIHLHFGGDGPLRDELSQRVAALGLQQRVTLHGHIDNVPAFLAKLDIVTLCSDSEGLPHALLEAMAAGRAVVATRVGGHLDLIDSDRDGVLVEPGQARALADAVLGCLANPDHTSAMARAGREKVWNRFDVATMLERLTSFYEELAQGRWSRQAIQAGRRQPSAAAQIERQGVPS